MVTSLHPVDLRMAMREGALQIAYQSQWDLTAAPDGPRTPARPVAVEALSRWHHPRSGPVPPDEFIPLAERGAFLDELDLDLLSRAAGQVAAWQARGHRVGLAVNAAPSHFAMPYARGALRVLETTGLDPASLTVEITESPAPQFSHAMNHALDHLRAAGVAVSVDDFGAAETTVGMLRGLPIDEVKIDRTLVQRADPEADAIVADVVHAARREGWRIVAEGIETLDDLVRSVRRGCDRGQGFYWGRPMDAERMAAALA